MSFRNPTYNQLAQAAHAGVAATLVLSAGLFGYQYWVTALIFGYGLVKEFWFDLDYERPEVSGGFVGGLIDFTFYCVGLAFANSVLWISGS